MDEQTADEEIKQVFAPFFAKNVLFATMSKDSFQRDEQKSGEENPQDEEIDSNSLTLGSGLMLADVEWLSSSCQDQERSVSRPRHGGGGLRGNSVPFEGSREVLRLEWACVYTDGRGDESAQKFFLGC